MRNFIHLIQHKIVATTILFLLLYPVSSTAARIYNDSAISVSGTLSATLTDFAVLINQDEARINWSIESGSNCTAYYVERSIDGSLFTKTASVSAHTSTNETRYSIADNIATIQSSEIYYRLIQVNKDGKMNYSKVVRVRLQVDPKNFIISPNTFTNYSNIKLNWGINEAATVKVLTLNGRVLLCKNIELSLGQNSILIGEFFAAAPGNYLIQVNSKHGNLTKEFIKQ